MKVIPYNNCTWGKVMKNLQEDQRDLHNIHGPLKYRVRKKNSHTYILEVFTVNHYYYSVILIIE